MTMINAHAIYFRHARKVLVPIDAQRVDPVSYQLIATFLKNIENYGFTLSDEAIDTIRASTDLGSFIRFAKNVTAILKKELGAHVRHEPMYPNFPSQVMNASESELYINALRHYLGNVTGERILPLYEKEEREALTQFKDLEILELGNDADFISIFGKLVSSKLALSASDVDDVAWFITTYKARIAEFLPTEISNKENLATVAGLIHTHVNTVFPAFLLRAKTATDVLRIAATLSGSNASLSDGVRFSNFSKPSRRALLSRLEEIANHNGLDTLTEDMLRNKALWKTLGEKLHPGDFAQRFPQAFAAFQILRNNEAFLTFGGKVEKAIIAEDIDTALALLITRPGELARRLDKLIRIGVHPKRVVKAFAEVADKVSSTVLWQVRSHFEHRTDVKGENSMRAFFPKGSIANIYGIPNTLPDIKEKHATRIVAICDEALNTIYARKESLGKVYVDPDLARFVVPSSVRSSSRSLNVVGRGTRTPIVTGDTIRFFIWWKDGIERTDLDLSAVLLNENYGQVGELAYTNLRGFGGVHSGDITSAPNGASEYIDVSIKKLKEHKVRYVVMVVNSYTNQPFAELPECFAGVMGRENANSGEVYEPRTVDNIFDITGDTRVAIPLIIDVDSMESVWTDLALTHNPYYVNNVIGNSAGITLATQTILNVKRPSLYDLFAAHASARGEVVNTPEEADVSFTATGGKVSVPATEILADYL